MFLSVDDMFVLHQLCANLKSDDCVVSQESIDKFEEILNKLDKQKSRRNEMAKDYVKTKRKTDKTYAQSYERKNKILGI